MPAAAGGRPANPELAFYFRCSISYRDMITGRHFEAGITEDGAGDDKAGAEAVLGTFG